MISQVQINKIIIQNRLPIGAAFISCMNFMRFVGAVRFFVSCTLFVKTVWFFVKAVHFFVKTVRFFVKAVHFFVKTVRFFVKAVHFFVKTVRFISDSSCFFEQIPSYTSAFVFPAYSPFARSTDLFFSRLYAVHNR